MSEVPAVDTLARDAILKSMLDNISAYQKQEPSVKIDALKENVLQKVIDAPDLDKPDVTFDPEVQLRGFLQAFAETPAFSAKIRLLDNKTQTQITSFRDDKNWKGTVEDGFRLPGYNPAVSRVLGTSSSSPSCITSILSCLTGVLKPLSLLFLNLKMGFAAEMLAKEQAAKYAGGPKIYESEDKATPKQIEVSPIVGVQR